MPEATGTIGADTFASAISQVAIAAGRDDTLPALTGIRVEINDDALTLIATDRYRLAIRELRWNPVVAGLNTAVLIPARVLGDTARSLTGGAEVSVALATAEGNPGEGIIGFEGGEKGSTRRTTTRLLSGEYPRIQQLLPTEYTAVAELPAAPFAEAVKRVKLVAERNTPVRLTFNSSEVLLEAGAGEDAQASEAISASYDGEEMQIAFNPDYLLDGIGAIDSDVVRISFTSPTRPAVVTGKGEAQPDYRYVLMPIRSAG
jgi:DNA polymerase-3 subunit beta